MSSTTIENLRRPADAEVTVGAEYVRLEAKCDLSCFAGSA